MASLWRNQNKWGENSATVADLVGKSLIKGVSSKADKDLMITSEFLHSLCSVSQAAVQAKIK